MFLEERRTLSCFSCCLSPGFHFLSFLPVASDSLIVPTSFSFFLQPNGGVEERNWTCTIWEIRRGVVLCFSFIIFSVCALHRPQVFLHLMLFSGLFCWCSACFCVLSVTFIFVRGTESTLMTGTNQTADLPWPATNQRTIIIWTHDNVITESASESCSCRYKQVLSAVHRLEGESSSCALAFIWGVFILCVLFVS